MHVDNDTRVCYDGDICVRQALAAQGMRLMENRCKADVAVALDVAKPRPLSQLVVALVGLVAVTRRSLRISSRAEAPEDFFCSIIVR